MRSNISNPDPIAATGNLRMNHVERLFQTLALESDLISYKDRTYIGQRCGGALCYTEESGALNPSLKQALSDFKKGEKQLPADFKIKKGEPLPDLRIGKNIVLILLRADEVLNLGQENEQPTFDTESATHYTVLNLRKNEDESLSIRYSDSLGAPSQKDKLPEVLKQILLESGINLDDSQQEFQSAKQGVLANCGYCAVYNSLLMLGAEIEQKDITTFIDIQKKFLEQEFGIAAELEDFEDSISTIDHQGSSSEVDEDDFGDDLESSDSSSDSEPEDINISKNSLEESFRKSLSRLSISKVTLAKASEKSLAVHDDDSSDEEDTKTRFKTYRGTDEAWERFLSPRVYYGSQEYPLLKQPDGSYKVNIPQINSLFWENLNLSQHDSITIGNPATVISYIYFGPREYNKPSNQHLSDQRVPLFRNENYDRLKASFELHCKGIEALYEDRISDQYYAKKSEKLSSKGQLEKLKAETGSAINKALSTLCLSNNWNGGVNVGLKHLHDTVLEKLEVKTAFEELMLETLQKRAFSTRISGDTNLEKLHPFSEKIYDELFGAEQNQIYSLLGSVSALATDELRAIGAVTKRGKKGEYYWAPPSQTERGKSYEELVNAKRLPKTKLGKFAWSIVKELETSDNIFSALESKKEHLLNDLIEDLSHLTQTEIDAKFRSLQQNITTSTREQALKILDNLIIHNLSNIPLHRKTFSDNVETLQESFSDIMVNIRLSNRSQSRRVKNLQQEEGDKVWSKTVTWAHAFESDAQSHALEKETITSKAGRNSLILDFGKYEEGKRKGNTVTEGIDKLMQDLKIDDKAIAHSVIQILHGTPANEVRNLKNDMIHPSETHCSILTNIAGLLILEFKRNPNFTSFMTLDLIKAGKITWKGALDQQGKDGGMLPMSITDAMKAARCLHDLYSPYLPHPYQIQGTEKFDTREGKVLDLVSREHEIHSKWLALHREISDERDTFQTSREYISAKRIQIEEAEQKLSGSKGKLMESISTEIDSLKAELEHYQGEKSEAKKKIKSLGSTTIEDRIQSESPGSKIKLGKTSKLKHSSLSQVT